jgi:hypothetical protein
MRRRQCLKEDSVQRKASLAESAWDCKGFVTTFESAANRNGKKQPLSSLLSDRTSVGAL